MWKVIFKFNANKMYTEDDMNAWKKSIEEDTQELILRMKKYDFRSFLPYVFIAINSRKNFDFYKGEDKEVTVLIGLMEYLCNLITTLDVREMQFLPMEKEVAQETLELTQKIFHQSIMMQSLQIKDKIRMQMHLQTMSIRGDTYQAIMIDGLLRYGEAVDAVIEEEIGFKIGDVIALYRHIIHHFESLPANIQASHEYFKAFADNYKGPSENLMKDFELDPVFLQMKEQINAQMYAQLTMEITPRNEKEKQILDFFSIEIGDNRDYDVLAWGPTLLDPPFKPVIRFQGRYYCFHFEALLRNLKDLIEEKIKKTGKRNLYESRRGDFVESEFALAMSGIYPGAVLSRGLYYKFQGKVCEADIIVQYGEYVILAEAKGGSLRPSERRGAASLFDGLEDIVEYAHSQCSRTKEYILTSVTSEVKFYSDANLQKEAIVIKREDLEQIFMMNVTLQNLGAVGTNIHLLDSKEESNEYSKEVWTVYLYDLFIIKDLTESAGQFINYVDRRINFQSKRGILVMDEMAAYGHFLSDGFYFDDGYVTDKVKLGDQDFVLFDGSFSDPIDEWYIDGGVKPRQAINEFCKGLIGRVEAHRKFGSIFVSKTLLSLSGGDLKEIEDHIHNLIHKNLATNPTSDFCLLYSKLGLGISFIGIKGDNLQKHRESKVEYAKAKTLHWECEKYILIYLIYKEDSSGYTDYEVDFDIIHHDDKFLKDPKVLAILESIKTAHTSKNVIQRGGKKLKGKHRNIPCTCGSGKKYKKCCGKN